MRATYLFSILLVTILLTSCSGSNVIFPSDSGDVSQNGLSRVYVSDWDANGNPNQGMGILGVFQGYIDLSNLTAELTSVRSLGTTDVIEVVDITGFLKSWPCTDCVELKSISMNSDGYPVLVIGIKHPFAAGDPLKPTTGKNRADLQVFNIEGVVAISSDSSTTYPSLGVKVADITLANADGYTSYLDEYLDLIMATDADIHPYILHFADYSQGNFDPASETGFTSFNNPIPSGNLVMPMGSDFDYRDYVFKMNSGDGIEFIYAVGCTYAITTSNKSERFTPDYRIPQDNKKAASEVWVEVADNQLQPGVVTSDADLVVSVLDINHGVPVGDGRNEMAHDSSVSGISVEIPGVELGAVTANTFIGGDGRDPMNPLQFAVTIVNSNAAGTGTYQGLVKVLDSYPPGANLASSLEQKDGISRVGPTENPLTGLFTINEFATYATFEISIGQSLQDPIAVIATNPSPAEIDTYHATVLFDSSGSYDPDGGSITLVEWDFDWDGIPGNFVPDFSGTESSVQHDYGCMPATLTAGLRVTDDDSPAGVSDIVSVTITITAGTSAGSWENSSILGTDHIWGDEPYNTAQCILVDSSGLAHIITSQNSLAVHRTYDGSILTPPIPIPGIASNNGLTASIDNEDEIHVVWHFGSPDVIYHTQTDGGVFTGVVDTLHTTASGYTGFMTCISSNALGQTMITWLNLETATSNFSDWYYVVFEGAGHSSPQIIPFEFHLRTSPTENGKYTPCPNLVIAPDQSFHLFHTGTLVDLDANPVIFKVDWDGTSWNNRDLIYDPAGGIFWDYSVIYDKDDDIHIHGCISGPYRVVYLGYDAATDTWLNVINATSSAEMVANCANEIDEYGNIHLAWVDGDGFLKHKVYCKYEDESAIVATPSVRIDYNTLNNDQQHIDIAWDDDGSLLAVYQDRLQTGNLYFNRFSE